jgi:uncharacterized protein YerC
LSSGLSKLPSKQIDYFLSELLGEEERVMLAKRLAATIMFIEGHTLYGTAQVLHLSTSTVDRIYKDLSAGEYTFIIKNFKKDKRTFTEFLEILDSILHVGGIMPHRVGLDRYKGLN